MPVMVEADIANGLPAFTIVGLTDRAIQEARERVKPAIRNAGYKFPQRRVTVNLAPAELPKEGTGFDLAIAIAILRAEDHRSAWMGSPSSVSWRSTRRSAPSPACCRWRGASPPQASAASSCPSRTRRKLRSPRESSTWRSRRSKHVSSTCAGKDRLGARRSRQVTARRSSQNPISPLCAGRARPSPRHWRSQQRADTTS